MVENVAGKIKETMETLAGMIKDEPSLSAEMVREFSIMERSFYVMEHMKSTIYPLDSS